MTVEELRAIQDREDLRDRHVIELREDGFTLAHTDDERTVTGLGGPALEACPVYEWALTAGAGFAPGVYLLRRDRAQDVDGRPGYALEALAPNAAETTRR